MSDLISRCELFNRLATIPAPPEANDFKAEIYKVIQGMETEQPHVVAQISLDKDLVAEEVMRRIKEEYDYEPKRGEWKRKDPYWHTAICSNCNKVTMFEEWDEKVIEYDFCPNCGADMRGGEQ